MTQGFDEWHEDTDSLCPRRAFNAGAASRQAEIDSLRIKLDGANERAAMTLSHKNKMVDKMQAEIDELQKRISKVLGYVGNDFDDYYTGGMVESIHEILKGESNE